jgi:hypothetical protein
VEAVGVRRVPAAGCRATAVAGIAQPVRPDLLRDGRLIGGGLTETLERTSASVTRNDAQGTPFQPDVAGARLRASPLLGTPQGSPVTRTRPHQRGLSATR